MASDCLMVKLQGSFQGVNWQDFLITARTLEEAFDSVSEFVNKGLVLQKITLRQAGRWMDWPLEAFTGQPLEAVTQSLQQDWEDILAPVPRINQIRWQRQAYLRRQIQLYERQIQWATQYTSQLKKVCQQPASFHDSRLAEHQSFLLENRLRSYQSLLANLHACAQSARAYLQEYYL